MRRFFLALSAASLVAALTPAALGAPAEIGRGIRINDSTGAGDATVVAILDSGMVPYHWDYLASKMPQHIDKDPSNDLPLTSAPDAWLPGFPSPDSFSSYKKLKLGLEEKDASVNVAALGALDQPKWATVKQSTSDDINYYWLPGTKVIGAIDFGTSQILGTPSSHGQGTTSSAVGNLHGTCPECLLLFINTVGATKPQVEDAINWAMSQPWIDVITNSYGFSLGNRDRIYSGSDVAAQRKATQRGQTIFFSAGNGQENAFLAPNTTSFSSQEGPDWIITVGAVSAGENNHYFRDDQAGVPFEPLDKTAYHASYTGHGKPADIAGIGANYPTAYGSDTVGGTGSSGFGGTSNATPQIGGTYARALYLARRDLRGASRIQRDGVIAVGADYDCRGARTNCELGDGELTADELRERLFFGAIHTEAGMTPAGAGELPVIGEEEFLNEGHGSYFGRETGRLKDWLAEFDRILGPLEGRAKALARPPGEREWMIVDSFCRQHIWGSWTGGYYVDGKIDLPGPDPAVPLRSAIETGCPFLQAPP